MNGAEVLREARELVASGWCQHAEARTQRGTVVDACAGKAAKWSLLGALQVAAFLDAGTDLEDVRVAMEAIAELIADPSLAHWNDAPERTRDQVTELLERAEHLASLYDAPFVA
ncbi:MAG: hypothetical protein ACJ76I_02320 [Gaiellaceae bacterium]